MDNERRIIPRVSWRSVRSLMAISGLSLTTTFLATGLAGLITQTGENPPPYPKSELPVITGHSDCRFADRFSTIPQSGLVVEIPNAVLPSIPEPTILRFENSTDGSVIFTEQVLQAQAGSIVQRLEWGGQVSSKPKGDIDNIPLGQDRNQALNVTLYLANHYSEATQEHQLAATLQPGIPIERCLAA